MSGSVYSFRAGPTYRAASRQELFDSAMEQPLSLTSTFFDQAKGGMLESYGLGTAIRDFAIPEGVATPGTTVRSALRLTNPLTAAYESTRLAVQAFREESPVLDEAKYKSSPWYRENIPWDAGMTEARARALAEWNDAKQVRQYYAQKRPISAFLGNLTGQAFDPINYVPVGGPLVRAAAVARAGRIGGAVITGAVDAATNTALAGLATRETRGRFGDDVSFQAMVSEIATAALIGAAFGGVGGALEARTASRALADAQRSLATLKTTQEARIALNEAIDGVVRGEDVTLSPNATEAVTRVSSRITFPDSQERAAAIARIVREDFPVGQEPRKPTTLMQFLASEGGIKDDGGELASMGLSRKFIPGEGALVRRTGRSLDYAREAAAEAGFFDDIYGDPATAVAKSTPDDLLRLLARELSGNPAYSNQFEGRLVQDRLDYDTAVKAREQYRRIVEEVDSARDVLKIEHNLDDAIIRRAARYAGMEGMDAVDALERAIEEDYRAFAAAMDERGEGFGNEPEFDIPFFEDATAGQGAGQDAGAQSGRGGRAGRGANATDRFQSAAPRVDEGTALAVKQAETRIAKPDNYKALADQYRVDPETGDFPELADIDNLRAEGRLTADDIAELDAASATVDDAKAYGEALKTVIGCIL